MAKKDSREKQKSRTKQNGRAGAGSAVRQSYCEITALYADENGEIFDAPGIGGVGRIGGISVH